MIGGGKVFPTRVGMNLTIYWLSNGLNSIPHTRGDEPLDELAKRLGQTVFPTRVGMNQGLQAFCQDEKEVFPTRVGMNLSPSGNLPTWLAYSPHAWG